MKLLKTINDTANKVTEDAAGGAVGAGSVAMCATPLFSTLVSRSSIPTVVQPTKKKAVKPKGLGLKEAFDGMGGAADQNTSSPVASSRGSDFDASGVVSKLKGLEKKEKQDHRDTVTFGLEDDNDGLVRVIVKSEQAPEFEKALQSFLSADDDDPMDIAEILFTLKDRFDIVDVQWPDVAEDEEQDTVLGGGEGEMPPMDPAAEGDLGAGGDMPPDMSGAGEDQAASVLTQVIDMMKADAEARKAEAHAREAEAKAKEADTIVQQAMTKVKQEEQYLDMDAYNKSKKEEDREAKRLAQLAKWKHDMSDEQGATVEDDTYGQPLDTQRGQPRAPEEEERAIRRPAPTAPQRPNRGSTVGGRVRPQDVANFILNRVK